MKQEIRLIGGTLRGKKIAFPVSEGLRPTPSRIRETLFNWLMHRIRGARVLDAFAGSGALGFEAFSRGAREVVLLEKSPRVVHQLKQTCATLAVAAPVVWQGDAIAYLNNPDNAPFDIIFLDPPFADADFSEYFRLCAQPEILHPEGLLYVESPVLLTPSPDTWITLHAKRAGDVFYALYSPVLSKPHQ